STTSATGPAGRRGQPRSRTRARRSRRPSPSAPHRGAGGGRSPAPSPPGAGLRPGGAWAASRRVLSAGLAAARALRSESAEAYFLHQLGSLALCLGEREDALSQLSEALQIRERLGDREGA